MSSVLSGILGSRVGCAVLRHLYHYGEMHARAIAADVGSGLAPVQRQLQRFEDAGVLVSRMVGRTRVYAFNPMSPFTSPLRALVKVAYDTMPLREREKVFCTRQRPRRKGKPVIRDERA